MRPVSFLIIGAGNRGNRYAKYSQEHFVEMHIKGVAEPRQDFKQAFVKKYKIKKDFIFNSWEQALERDKFADAVIITTLDRMHYQPSIQALQKGYDILVEKPIAPTIEECKGLVEASKKYKKIFGVCHVLRHTDYYRKIKELLDSKVIGDIATIEHTEGVEYWHQAHSFVRGNWRNQNESCPMILAKSCHDMDILRWLVGRPCKKIASFGSLFLFKKENAPEGSTKRCIDGCKVEKTCPFSALKNYLNPRKSGWPIDVLSLDTSMKARRKALSEGPYGRCVYHCDNDVVDHQVVICEFEGGITASFTMTAFTPKGEGRYTRIMGTKGEIIANSRHIEVKSFLGRRKERISFFNNFSQFANSGHGGGDEGIIKDFIKAVRQQDASCLASSIEVSLEGHIMALLAEQSRLENKVFFLNPPPLFSKKVAGG